MEGGCSRPFLGLRRLKHAYHGSRCGFDLTFEGLKPAFNPLRAEFGALESVLMYFESLIGSFPSLYAFNKVLWASHACVFVVANLTLNEVHVMEWNGSRHTLLIEDILRDREISSYACC